MPQYVMPHALGLTQPAGECSMHAQAAAQGLSTSAVGAQRGIKQSTNEASYGAEVALCSVGWAWGSWGGLVGPVAWSATAEA